MSGSSNLIPLPTFQSELLFTLLCYATALNNHAGIIVQSLSSDTPSKGRELAPVATAAEEKGRVDKLAQAVDFLCRASGIFEHVCDKMLPAWDAATRNVGSAGSNQRKGKDKMPVECSREVVRGMAV
jgi:hypothetical protein